LSVRLALQPVTKPGWSIQQPTFEPFAEGDIEAMLAVGNGLMGIRAARTVSRGPTWIHWLNSLRWTSSPRTYVAGLFDRPNTDPPIPALVPAADFWRVRILLDGEPLLLRCGETLLHCRTLDMRRGALLADWRQRTEAGVVARISTLRLASMAERALTLQLLRLELDPAGAQVTLEASFEGAGLGMTPDHLEQDLGVWRTSDGRKQLALAGAPSLQIDGTELAPDVSAPLTWTWNWTSAAGHEVTFQRLVALTRGDQHQQGAGGRARQALDHASRVGWRAVLNAHEAAWVRRWRDSDVTVAGDDDAQKAIRFATYHLNIAANPEDERVSIGARALTGDSYFGHVFWDTEIYLLPFYTLTWPEAAWAMLMYRFHTLSGARAKAAKAGYRGASFAWESADTGEETTPEKVVAFDGKIVPILCGIQEQHISADISYAVWHYWRATADDAFLQEAGAEIIIETARFWASRAVLEADGKRHVRAVIGPDEFHETIDDNAFTNLMARWNLRRGAEVFSVLRERWPDRLAALKEKLALDDAEPAEWLHRADEMFVPFNDSSGLYEQFEGYFNLDDIDLKKYAGRTKAMDVLLGREGITKSQILKQADVVALLALLPEEFNARSARANFDYYEARCAHDSSLSRAWHAMVAARMGDMDMALRYFRAAAAVEFAGPVGGRAGGIHIALLGGLWQAAVLGFGGLSMHGETLALDPHLPKEWDSLDFPVHWRGRRVRFTVTHKRIDAVLEDGERLTIMVQGRPLDLRPGRGAPKRALAAAS
jgi:trehalose/maltose hydrolase-like predicted phosphorylase